MNELVWSLQAPIVLLAGALLIIVFMTVRSVVASRRARAAQLMKSTAAIGLLVILLGPSLADDMQEIRKGRLLVLVDASRSMGIHDAGVNSARSRLESLREGWLSTRTRDEYEKVLSPSYAVISNEYRTVSSSQRLASAPVGNTTPLAESLRLALETVAPDSRILALTDGIDTEADEDSLQSVAALAAARSVRIDVAIAGADAPLPALRIRTWAEPEVVFHGESSTLHIDVFSTGMDGSAAELTVYEGYTGDGATIFRRRVQLGDRTSISFPVAPQGGIQGAAAAYTVTIETIGADAEHTSRTKQVFIEVLDQPVRVVLFDAQPHWETTFFTEALRDDPNIELTTVVALTPHREIVRHYSPRSAGRIDHLDEIDLANLGEFDVIVLGKGVERWFDADHAEALRRFVVEDGGALILLRGDPISSRDDGPDALRRIVQVLSPATYSSVVPSQPSVRREDVAVPVALDDVPEIRTTRMNNGAPGWYIWLHNETDGADDEPLIAVGSVGRGRTIALLISGMWRFAMSPNTATRSRSLYGRLWSSLVRWLALEGEYIPGRALSIRFGAGQHQLGEPIEIMLRSRRDLSAPGPSATVRSPDGAEHQLMFIRQESAKLKWTASFTPALDGVYEIVASSPGDESESVTGRLAVYENRRELLDSRPRREQMLRFAQATGGRVWAVDGADQYLHEIQKERAHTAVLSARDPAWDEPWVFVMIFGMLGASWLISHRRGSA